MAIAHTPGPKKDGRIFMDCGCWVNTLIQYRCPLHTAAPDLLAALESVRDGYQQLWDVMPVAWQGFDNIAEQAIEKARNG